MADDLVTRKLVTVTLWPSDSHVGLAVCQNWEVTLTFGNTAAHSTLPENVSGFPL